MPIVLMDVTRLADRALQKRKPTGVDRVGLAYVRHFGARALALVRVAGRWVVLDEPDSKGLFDALLSPGPGFSRLVRWLVGKHYALNWQALRKGDVLLNVMHSGLDRQDYVEHVRRFGLRPIFFLHDLIPLRFPEYGRPGDDEKHHRRVLAMLESACGLIVNSAATGEELEAYATSLDLLAPPWVAAHLAPALFPVPSNARPILKPYFVVLGTIEPRKNHLLLLNLWRDLAGRLGSDAPCLVMIGQRGWECEQVVDMLERCEALKDFVFEINSCNDADLVNWLYNAQALLFPSFAEGYGIPLVEALSLGTPVIASNLPVFLELAGGIPEYLDPLDGLEWRRAILDYAEVDSPRRLAQQARMKGWRAPTWKAHFDKVEELMSRCLA